MTNDPPKCPHCKEPMTIRCITGDTTGQIEIWNCYKCAENYPDGRQKRWEIVILPFLADKDKK